MPFFLSTVVVVGLLLDVLNPFNGPLSEIIRVTGITGLAVLGRSEAFRFQYLISAVWQHVGFGSIIYLAAIAGVNPEPYEAAVIDGAGRPSQVRHVTLPGILPTVTILFILAVGGILGNDFQKILLLYSPMNYNIADVISTYIYRVGLEAVGSNFSYATAVGLSSAAISVLFLVVANRIAKSLSEFSLW
jgi:putative aldouronate transport system permease protein